MMITTKMSPTQTTKRKTKRKTNLAKHRSAFNGIVEIGTQSFGVTGKRNGSNRKNENNGQHGERFGIFERTKVGPRADWKIVWWRLFSLMFAAV
jgi:hypothetical protein